MSYSPNSPFYRLLTTRYDEDRELEIAYHIKLDAGKLVAGHIRHPNIVLNPIKADVFSGNQWFFGNVVFVKNTDQAIQGMNVSSGRVRNVWFEKNKTNDYRGRLPHRT